MLAAFDSHPPTLTCCFGRIGIETGKRQLGVFKLFAVCRCLPSAHTYAELDVREFSKAPGDAIQAFLGDNRVFQAKHAALHVTNLLAVRPKVWRHVGRWVVGVAAASAKLREHHGSVSLQALALGDVARGEVRALGLKLRGGACAGATECGDGICTARGVCCEDCSSGLSAARRAWGRLIRSE